MFTEQARKVRENDRFAIGQETVEDFITRASDAGFMIDVDAPETDEGEWLLDLSRNSFRTPISWKRDRGFGLYTSEIGYGDRPSEIFSDPSVVLTRLKQLYEQWTNQGSLSVPSLAELRQLTNTSQEELGRIAHLKQSAISRFEGREDFRLSTLVSYLEALGGRVEVRVHFDGMDVALNMPKVRGDEACSA